MPWKNASTVGNKFFLIYQVVIKLIKLGTDIAIAKESHS